MWPFLLIGSSFTTAAVLSGRRSPHPVAWIVAFIALTLFVGLRHNVGMDWNNYLRMIWKVTVIQDYSSLFLVSEIGYALLLVLGDKSGYGIYGVNLLTTLVFMAGLFCYARRTPEPWIALVVALPFYVMVFAMSANRQALAAGILIWLLAYWQTSSILKRFIWIIFAALFHISALLMLAFVVSSMTANRLVKIVVPGFVLMVALGILLFTNIGEYYAVSYLASGTVESEGALLHVSLNALPAMLYFLFPSQRSRLFPTTVLKHMAFAAVAMLPLALISSVTAGRLSLYLFPVSLWVFAALPSCVAPKYRVLIRTLIATSMMAVMLVWLNFANSAHAHLPYRNALLIPSWELEIGILP